LAELTNGNGGGKKPFVVFERTISLGTIVTLLALVAMIVSLTRQWDDFDKRLTLINHDVATLCIQAKRYDCSAIDQRWQNPLP
jgi:HJR/Mrr/RecB family endonuclease